MSLDFENASSPNMVVDDSWSFDAPLQHHDPGLTGRSDCIFTLTLYVSVHIDGYNYLTGARGQGTWALLVLNTRSEDDNASLERIGMEAGSTYFILSPGGTIGTIPSDMYTICSGTDFNASCRIASKLLLESLKLKKKNCYGKFCSKQE